MKREQTGHCWKSLMRLTVCVCVREEIVEKKTNGKVVERYLFDNYDFSQRNNWEDEHSKQ